MEKFQLKANDLSVVERILICYLIFSNRETSAKL